MAEQLIELGADVRFHDPFVADWTVSGVRPVEGDLESAVAAADLTILLQNHKEYDVEALAGAATALFDTRGVTQDARTHRL